MVKYEVLTLVESLDCEISLAVYKQFWQ